ncbi:MAG TPA: hypothetical protein VGJ92_02805 [Methanocella sp.]
MVRSKIRLAVTVLIVLAICTGLVISTAEAKSGSTSGKSASSTGKGTSMGTTGFNTAATGKVSVSATPAFGSSVFGKATTASDNVFGTTNSQVDATRQGSFVNSFGQSFTPGVTAFGNPMAAATNTFGSSVFGNAVTQADNVFGTTNSMVDATRQGSFINSFGQSFVPGVTNFGQVQVAADRTGSFITSDTQSII